MIRPTDNLRADHTVVLSGVQVLAAIGARVAAGDPFPAADCAVVLRFLREFVIGVHMHKESMVVCPALAMHGSEDAATLVGEVLRVHDEVVELTHALVMFWEPASELSAAERAGFAQTVDAVIARLRRLAATEEAELFPACDAAVPADDQLDWMPEFVRAEAGRASRREWRDRLAVLATRWCPLPG
jgi:hemerythrin-like domain-containing protein